MSQIEYVSKKVKMSQIMSQKDHKRLLQNYTNIRNNSKITEIITEIKMAEKLEFERLKDWSSD